MSETKKDGVGYMSDILNLLVQKGVMEDKRIADARIRSDKQKKNQKAYHNTELLLRHYRDIVWLMECFPDTIEEELEEPLENIDELIEKLDLEMAKNNRRIENRMKNLERTRLMLDRINEALTVLRKKPNDGERLYELIKLTYIDAEVLNHNELLFRLNISSRQYYRMREQAFAILSLRLWAAPDREVGTWLDVLNLLEQKGNSSNQQIAII